MDKYQENFEKIYNAWGFDKINVFGIHMAGLYRTKNNNKIYFKSWEFQDTTDNAYNYHTNLTFIYGLIKYPQIKEYILKKKDTEYNINGFYRLKETNRLKTLSEQKEQLKREIVKYKNTYSFIDDIFQQEINDKKNKELWWLYNICFCNETEIINKVLKYD